MTDFYGRAWIEPAASLPPTARPPEPLHPALAGLGRPPIVRRAAPMFPRSVRLTFLLLVTAIPFETVDLGPLKGSLSLARITGVLFFAAAIRYKNQCFRRPPKPVFWFAVYLLILSLWVFFVPAVFRRGQISESLTIAQLLLLFWVSSNLMKDASLVKAILRTFAIGCFLLSVANLLELPGFVELVGDPESGFRVSALGYNLNELATLLSLGVLSAVGLLLDIARVKRWRRAAMLGIILPMLAVIVRTESRGGILALALALGFYLLPLGRPGRRIVGMLFGVLMLFGIVFLVARDPLSVSRWTKTYQQGDVAGRDKILKAARDMIKMKPVFGWGPVAYLYELGPRRGPEYELSDPHNLYVGMLAEVGVVGFIPFMWGLWLCTSAAWRARSGHFGLLPMAMMAMILIANLSGLWIQRKTMWLFMALALGTAAAMQARRPSPLPRFAGERLPLNP